MKFVKWAVMIICFVLAIVLISQNMPNFKMPVVFEADFYFVSYQTAAIPLGVVVFIAFAAGVVLMALCGITERFRLKKQVRILMADAKERDKEISSLKTFPVSGDVVGVKQNFDEV